jgi:peptidoglycan/LPS O-acetylase OafA/YrhL
MRFRALDGFRGLCALMVALYHFPVETHLTGRVFFLPHAQMLMDFFFVFSGFLIAGAYGERLKGWGDVARFARGRVARLWPLHAVTLGVLVALELAKAALAPGAGLQPPFTGAHAPAAILTNLLMIHSLHLHPMLTWNAPSWTVSVEIVAYLAFAVLTILLPRRRLAVAAGMALMGALGVALIARKLDANYDFGLFRCFYGFFCGVLTARLWRARPFPAAAGRGVATLVEAAAMLGVFAYITFLGGPPFGFAGPLVFSGFIWLYASERGGVTRSLSAGPLVRLGEISYSIYLIHFPIVVLTTVSLRSAERLLHVRLADFGYAGLDAMTFLSGPSTWILDGAMLAYLAVVIAAATQTHRLIEVPGRKLFDGLKAVRWPRFGRARSKGAPAAATAA